MDERTTEVVVVGAGFAGLAAAQVLGRAQRDVLLVGAGPTRNAEAEHAHNVLTRDGTPPAELLRLGMAEVQALASVTIRDEHVAAVRHGSGEGLRVELAGGQQVDAEVVVLATGARDVLPEVPGLAELWGTRAHSCPFCDAAAYAGQRLLILSDKAQGALKIALLSGWTDQLTLVDPGFVADIGLVGGEVVARLHDGAEVTADGVFVGVTPVPRVDCVAELPLARRGPYLAVDGEGRTSLPRLWAAGDCAWKEGEANPGGQVVASMAAGARAATWIVFDRLEITPPAPPPISRPDVAADGAPTSVSEFWERHYGQREQIWSGSPNQRLVDEVCQMQPGTALDLGCGEGADAVWLAERGWNVVAADVSTTALARGAQAAADRGVADRIDWRACDVGADFPDGEYDLVNAAYLLSPVTLPRVEILKAAARAVRPGGVLLILSHAGFPPGADAPDHHIDFPTPHEQLDAFELSPDEWIVEAAEEFEAAMHRSGLPATRVDNVLRLHRR
jgi:thioredoxin reductase/SAM-dependent methyltransferase